MKKLQIVGASLTLLTIVTACNKSDVMETPVEPKPELTASTQDFSDVRMCSAPLLEGTTPRAAVFNEARWPNGSTIKVSLNGGSNYVRNKVIQYAKEWEKYANIKFNFVRNDRSAPIRVSFVQNGHSWSYKGTHALGIHESKATMNFGWFDNDTDDDEFSSTTLHEFGHALGLIHEQSQPLANIPWDKPAVYAYFARQGWTKEDVDHNVFYKYSEDETDYSQYDKKSIMHYSVSNKLTIGDFEVGWNWKLSDLDKWAIGLIYPKK